MILAGTGHRTERLLGLEVAVRLETRDFLLMNTPSLVISGMAAGFDQILAVEALDLGIPVMAAMPFDGFGDRWPREHRLVLEAILEKCRTVHFTRSLYHPGVFQIRDEFMVDECTDLLTCWDGVAKGGTWNTISYANRVGRTTHHLKCLH